MTTGSILKEKKDKTDEAFDLMTSCKNSIFSNKNVCKIIKTTGFKIRTKLK